MTEADWLSASDVHRLLGHVDSLKGMERKLDSFALACCLRLSHLHTDSRTREVVTFLETNSLYDCGDQEFEWARDLSAEASRSLVDSPTLLGQAQYHAAYAVNQFVRGLHGPVAEYCSWAAFDAKQVEAYPEMTVEYCAVTPDPDEDQIHCHLLRCIVGNPFRPAVFDPAWRSETVVTLAAGIYEGRAFDRLPILADALEEVGCDHTDVLAHCRGPGPHARDCWVVDGVLGKS